MGLNVFSKRKVLFVVSEDYYFVSHRLGLARDLSAKGWNVLVATQVNSPVHAKEITEAGLHLKPMALKRGSLIAIGDMGYLFRLIVLYWRERPDVVHHVAMKPVLWGSIAAVVCRGPRVVNALAGLGHLFTSARRRVRIVRGLVLSVFRVLFSRKGALLILQNREDVEEFQNRVGVPAANLRLIRGAGVDVAQFAPVQHGPREAPVIVMVSRMLRDKGVAELVAAARALKADGVKVEVKVVGGIDEGNPNSFSLAEMASFQQTGAISWLGHRSDIARIYGSADIAVLPSYREGLPKTLLEAAACGLPIVTTDTTGCREMVTDGGNGFLVPVKDSIALADALRKLVADWNLRARLGAYSRTRAETEFRQELIWTQTASVYDEVLSHGSS